MPTGAQSMPRLPSETDAARVNELRCKALCYNLCVPIQSVYELGIEPEF